jgi:hypothetical protein
VDGRAIHHARIWLFTVVYIHTPLNPEQTSSAAIVLSGTSPIFAQHLRMDCDGVHRVIISDQHVDCELRHANVNRVFTAPGPRSHDNISVPRNYSVLLPSDQCAYIRVPPRGRPHFQVFNFFHVLPVQWLHSTRFDLACFFTVAGPLHSTSDLRFDRHLTSSHSGVISAIYVV